MIAFHKGVDSTPQNNSQPIVQADSLSSLPIDMLLAIINQCPSIPESLFGPLSRTSKTLRHICWQLLGNHPFLFKIFSNWTMNIADQKTASEAFSHCRPTKAIGQSVRISFSDVSTFSMEKWKQLVAIFPQIEQVLFTCNKQEHVNTLSLKINTIIEKSEFIKTIAFISGPASLQKISFPHALTSLDVSYVIRDIADLVHISQSCSSLKELIMTNCTVLSEKAFRWILLPKTLEKLDITNNWVGIEELALIGKRCPSLKTLLFRCYGTCPRRFGVEVPAKVKKQFFPKSLQKLELDYRFLTEEVFSRLSVNCPSLTEFSIHSFQGQKKDFGNICLPKSIKKLTIWPSVNDSFLSAICRDCADLERLKVHSCQRLTTEGLARNSLPAAISRLSLSRLCLDESPVFNAFLQSAENLMKICLTECHFEEGVFEEVKWPKKIVRADFRWSNILSKELHQFWDANKQLTSITFADNQRHLDDNEVESIKIGFAALSLDGNRSLV